MKPLLISLIFATCAFAEIKTETTAVPMRDGVKLATDIYRDEAVGTAPVVLMRTPYDRTKAKGNAEKFAKAGYIAVMQDCRGSHASEGVMAPYNNEGQDGYDTLEWITRQPWCSGRVGMVGGSYVGAVQWQAAVENPPGLAAIAPQATWSSFYRNLYLGGAVRLSLISGWIAGNTVKPEGVNPADMSEALMHLPLSDVDEAIGWPMPWLDAMLTHPEPNGYWTRLDLTPLLPELQLPALHVVGYYDFFSRESVDNFMIMQKQARDPKTRRQQRLILGPWDHGSVGKTKVAEIEFGPEAAVDTFALQLDWFDRHLKQDPAALAKPFSPVRYFSMGDNVWHDAQTWPPEGFTATSFHLSSKGKANTREGDGILTREAPAQDQPADTFRADPANPTPSCPVTETRSLKAAVWGPVDQRITEDRDDVLVYTGEVMTGPLTFAGNAEAKLHVSTDALDADWAVKLIDVHPDGFAQNIARGILRGRYRDSLLEPRPMKPGEVVEITVDLGPVAATIAKGHQLRVDISGADFPLYDRNPNTAEGPFGGETVIANGQVHHKPGALSRIVLPVRAANDSPIVGAIRWDGWYGDGVVVKAVEATLGPPKYHFRLPWFARLMGEDKVDINGDSEAVMDQEIAYAAQAGLNYWAFLDYLDESPPMSIGLNRYLAAKDKKGIRYCLVEEGARLDTAGPKAWSRLVEHFRNPDYQTVLDGRPLLCLFSKTTKLGKADWDELKRQTNAVGLKSPYLVLMGGEAEKNYQALGFDAVSEYACAGKGYTNDPETYARLTSHHVREKLWDTWKRERRACITFASAGWDTRPRNERPPPWLTGVTATPDKTPPSQQKPLIDPVTATPDELAAHIRDAVEWTKANRDLNPANVIILYAWNEHDEGGWVQPTLGADGRPNEERIQALGKVLRPLRSNTAPLKQ